MVLTISENDFMRIGSNFDILLEAAGAGYDLVCSCPTCGFLMKILIKERACYSDVYQHSVHAGADEIKVPGRKAGADGFVSLNKSMYHKILKDDGYFNALDPLKRIALSDRVTDMGEYLDRLYHKGLLNTRLGIIHDRMVYFAPCHQREQEIGSPYENLLTLIPGLEIVRVGGAMDCCGMGGSLGLKESFYEKSIELGRPLFRKILVAAPEAIITDCLSCRLQFEHLLPYDVFHPLEVLSRAYESADLKPI
jgi:glycerol-3-phosphate dehydrogenase subunit C